PGAGGLRYHSEALRVDPYSGLAILRCQAPGELDHPSFGRVIRRIGWCEVPEPVVEPWIATHDTVDAADEHDRPTAPLGHQLTSRRCGEEAADEIQLNHVTLPGLCRGIIGDPPSCVRNYDVEPIRLFENVIEELFYGFQTRDIQCAATTRTE